MYYLTISLLTMSIVLSLISIYLLYSKYTNKNRKKLLYRIANETLYSDTEGYLTGEYTYCVWLLYEDIKTKKRSVEFFGTLSHSYSSVNKESYIHSWLQGEDLHTDICNPDEKEEEVSNPVIKDKSNYIIGDNVLKFVNKNKKD